MAAEGPEPLPDGGEDPAAFAARAAGHKARSVARRLASGCGAAPAAAGAPLVLAADTIVVLDGQILGKPGSPDPRAEALSMLTRLAGTTHSVITACCLHPVNPADAGPLCFADSTRVSFADWPEEVLRAYVDTGDPLDKAGAYGIQGKGAFLAERIEGSWSTVVGLPVSQTIRALLDMGALRPRSAAILQPTGRSL